MRGVTRPIDELGRVVLPVEMRRALGLGPGVPLEFFLHGSTVVLQRHPDACRLCGTFTAAEDRVPVGGAWACRSCAVSA